MDIQWKAIDANTLHAIVGKWRLEVWVNEDMTLAEWGLTKASTHWKCARPISFGHFSCDSIEESVRKAKEASLAEARAFAEPFVREAIEAIAEEAKQDYLDLPL